MMQASGRQQQRPLLFNKESDEEETVTSHSDTSDDDMVSNMEYHHRSPGSAAAPRLRERSTSDVEIGRLQPSPPQQRRRFRKGMMYSNSNITGRLVEWLQSIPVPCVRNNDATLFSGLDQIIGRPQPTPSCSEVVRIAGYKPPRYLWYMVSGFVCDILQFCLLFALHTVITDGSACWCCGFLLSISVRHSSHRHLVFGDYVGGYWKSLARMYAGYSVIVVLSTLFNFAVSRVFMVPTVYLWGLTMLWTGVANYFILKYFWSFGGPSASSAVSSTAATAETLPKIAAAASPSAVKRSSSKAALDQV